MVAIINEASELDFGQLVLEIGSGSGYQAATIAEIIGSQGHVFTVEIKESLLPFARKNLERAGYGPRVTVIHGDGSQGYAERSPYDRIIVTAAAPSVPRKLVDQLKPGGILMIPIGGRFYNQQLVRIRKTSDSVVKETLGAVSFVPLVGKEAHS